MATAPQRQPLLEELPEAAFRRISEVVERHLGIRLPPEKRTMVEQRLRRPLEQAGHATWAAFAAGLTEPVPLATMDLLANALTTNHTAFWREPEHFVHYRDEVLPERLEAKARTRDLRVWCAAAATGEEPYQLAMIQQDAVPPGWTAGLLATDISERALTTARAGRYSAERLGRLPPRWRERYVQADATGGVMTPALRSQITFRRLNLLGPWSFQGRFDVVFCRNVLIYFEAPVRDGIVRRLVDQLEVGGVLYVGHTENVRRDLAPIAQLATGVWRKVRSA